MPPTRPAVAVIGFASSVAAAAAVLPPSQPLTSDPFLLLLLWTVTASAVAPLARVGWGRALTAFTALVMAAALGGIGVAALGQHQGERPGVLLVLFGVGLASLAPTGVHWLAGRSDHTPQPRDAAVVSGHPNWGDPDCPQPPPVTGGRTRPLLREPTRSPRILHGRWLLQPGPLPGADPGGFSILRRAVDLHHQDRMVVVKLASRPFGSHDDRVARLMREGELLNGLHSPHVISLLDRGWEAGVFFLVLEYHPIGSLAGWLDRRFLLEMATITGITCEILRALTYLHHGLDEPVIHRDVNPRNLLVRDEQPALGLVLTDFGSARRQDLHGRTADAGITIGSVFSPYYAPPELVGGLQPSRWGPPTDIYGACAILYELLTGLPPYQREARRQGVEFHRLVLDPTVPPTPASLISRDLPPILGDILAAGLAYDPSARIAHAQDLLPLLEEIGHRHRSRRIPFADLRR